MTGPSRRAWLRGAGALLAAPLLASALPRVARSGVGTPPRRLLIFFVPNGMPPHLWTPAATGAGWPASPLLAALEPVRDEVAVVTGLANPVGQGDHANALRGLLTSSRHVGPASTASVDQLVAGLAGATPVPSLHLASEGEAPCVTGDCVFTNRLSWLAGGVAAPRASRLDAAWRRLFPGAGLEAGVLDAVRADLLRYRARAGRDDARRLEAFTDGLRAIETRAAAVPPSCDAGAMPEVAGDGALYGDDAHVRAMLGLIVQGFACDLTRVATFMLGNEASNRPLEFLGVPRAHHALSHLRDDAAHTTLGRWALGHWVELVEALAAVEEVDGSRLLDHTHVVFVGSMGDGATHDTTQLPVLVAGAGSDLPRGRHVAHDGRPIGDLWLSVLRAFGDSATRRFGDDGTTPLLPLF